MITLPSRLHRMIEWQTINSVILLWETKLPRRGNFHWQLSHSLLIHYSNRNLFIKLRQVPATLAARSLSLTPTVEPRLAGEIFGLKYFSCLYLPAQLDVVFILFSRTDTKYLREHLCKEFPTTNGRSYNPHQRISQLQRAHKLCIESLIFLLKDFSVRIFSRVFCLCFCCPKKIRKILFGVVFSSLVVENRPEMWHCV